MAFRVILRSPGLTARLAPIGLVAALLMQAGLGASCFGQEAKGRPTPPPPLPVPNGYDDLIRAAGLVRGIAPNGGQIAAADLDQLRGWVGLNAEALIAVREGLAKPSRVAVAYDQDLKVEMDHVQGCRNLGRLLTAEAEVASREGRATDAADSLLDQFRLGHATGRGGLLIDVQVGMVLERMATDGLARIRAKLPPASIRRALAVIQQEEAARPSVEEDLNSEFYYFDRTAPVVLRIGLAISKRLSGK